MSFSSDGWTPVMLLAGDCGWGKKIVFKDLFRIQTQEKGQELWNGKVNVWGVMSISSNRRKCYAFSELLPQIAQYPALGYLAEAGYKNENYQ